MRLIDADALIDTIAIIAKKFAKTDAQKALMGRVMYIIEHKTEQVVRCKDCRFCKKHPTSDKTKMCTNEQQWVTECYPLVFDNDYCSYGERKEE